MVQGQICLSLHCVLGKEKPYCCSKGLEHNVYNLKLAALENVGNYVVGTLQMTCPAECWFCRAPRPSPTPAAWSCTAMSSCQTSQFELKVRTFSKAFIKFTFCPSQRICLYS